MSSGMSAGAGTALAAAIQTGGALASGHMSSKSSLSNYKASAYLNYYLNQQSLLNSPLQMRRGLEKAGYNPILGASNGQTPFISGTNAQGGDYSGLGDIGQGITNAYKTFALEKQQVKNQTVQTESNVNVNNAQVENIRQDTENKKVQQGIFEMNKLEAQYSAEMKKFDKDTQEYRFCQEMAEMASRTKLNLQQAMFVGFNAESQRIAANAQTVSAQAQTESAAANKMDAETRQTLAGGSSDAFMERFSKRHPAFYGAYRHLDNTAALIGRVLGGAGSLSSGVASLQNAQTNAKGVSVETAKFDSNGSYKGHTRTTKKRK